MKLKEKLLELKQMLFSSADNNHDYEFEAELENHPIGNQDTYRLYYINYHRIGESYGRGPDNIGVMDFPLKPFKLPNGMTREEAFKVLSYLTDFIEKRDDISACSLKSVKTLDSVLDLERFGFKRVEETDENKILNLFTVDGRPLLFKNSDLYSKYFEWYHEGITLEEVKEIYKKHNMKFYDIIWNYEKEKDDFFDKAGRIEVLSLDSKVDEYINWNFENMVKGKYTSIGEYLVPRELRNLIEKMAVWYELRYPDYEINRILSGSGQENTKINDVMFNSNPYIESVFDEDSIVRILDWDKFYNKEAFMNSLSWEDRFRFEEPRYRNLVYLDPNCKLTNPMEAERKSAHLHLNNDGIVVDSEGVDLYTNFEIQNEELVGMSIEEVREVFKAFNINLPNDNEIDLVISNVSKWKKQKDGLLDCVMYRIIERGGNRIGPRRAFLFAKEFERNVDIPMIYGIDYSDPGLRRFINEYIKSGGRKDLLCYVNYFGKDAKTQTLETVSIGKLLNTISDNCVTKYTEEETELHQRLVNVLQEELENKEDEPAKVKKIGRKK